MLLDQKRTKRHIRILAIIASLAFVGVIVPVLGIALYQATTTQSPTQKAIDDAQAVTRSHPRSGDAWARLAGAYANAASGGTSGGTSTNPTANANAIAAWRKAVALTPARSPELEVRTKALSDALLAQNRVDEAIQVLSRYTVAHPNDPQGFLDLGAAAQQVGRDQIARLSFQRFLQLAPRSPFAATVRQLMGRLAKPSTGAPSGPTGGASPATPATP